MNEGVVFIDTRSYPSYGDSLIYFNKQLFWRLLISSLIVGGVILAAAL